MSDLSQPPPPSAPPPNTTTVIWDTESAVGSSDLGESAGGETCPCGGGRLVNGLCHGLTDGNGLSGVRRGESAGGETCPMRGRVGVRREVGKRTLSRTHGRKRIWRRDGEGVCWR